MTIIEALDDKKLFGPFFAKRADWAAWFVFLKVLFGLAVTEEETVIYRHHTRRETSPDKQAREAWLVVGRRGGKSRVASLIATYLAAFIDYREYLAPGELAFIPIVAVDKRQAHAMNCLQKEAGELALSTAFILIFRNAQLLKKLL